MKTLALSTTLLAIISLSGCYMTEDASDVNQERINTDYSTVFNATRGYTTTVLSFRFGHTPLRVSNAIYFDGRRLYEQEDLIFGLHYTRDIDGVSDGEYEWMDENGEVYYNYVRPYEFHLTQSVNQLKKGQYHRLGWEGEEIPYVQGDFTITIESKVDGTQCTFYVGKILEIDYDHLEYVPLGPARLIISRNYSEPMDEGTQAGGESSASFVREYETTITN